MPKTIAPPIAKICTPRSPARSALPALGVVVAGGGAEPVVLAMACVAVAVAVAVALAELHKEGG